MLHVGILIPHAVQQARHRHGIEVVEVSTCENFLGQSTIGWSGE